jgi:hypothetical protein
MRATDSSGHGPLGDDGVRPSDLLERVEAAREGQAALFAAREATLAAREAELVARLDERGRVIAGLTAHLRELTALREEDRQALDRARRSLRVSRLRLASARRTSLALARFIAAARPKPRPLASPRRRPKPTPSR